MTEANTIQVTQDSSTENYEVYESADGETIVGMYVESSIADSVGEFAAVTIQDTSEVTADATANKNKDTANYGVYELPPAITGMYLSHDTLDSEESDDGPTAPDEVGLSLAPSDESAFEASLASLEDQSDALLDDNDDGSDESAGTAEEQAEALVTGSDDSNESESNTDADDAEVEISDEEIGL